jgi:hypothetical protein
MTSFDPGQSTYAQRIWIMFWIAFGAYIGLIMEFSFPFHSATIGTLVMGCVIYGAPAIGGMVVVGQEINSYGVCKRL